MGNLIIRSLKWLSMKAASYVIATEASVSNCNAGSDFSSNKLQETKSQLGPMLLRGVHDFWFEHLTGPEDVVLPDQKQSERWFIGSDEFDVVCLERFGAALEAIQASGMKTGQDVIELVNPAEPLDWVSLILLLDQLPRNCYRGRSAAVAFTFFDPIARDVALAAIARGMPEREPQLRWQFGYRKWFYLPLMHSEELEAHELATRGFELMRKDVYMLADDTASVELESLQHNALPDYPSRAARVIGANPARSRMTIDRWCMFEKKHMDIIKHFGRYPHRNVAMQRTCTVEEKNYLENGGETFARPK